MKFIITGGLGFIGSSFTNLCLEQGHEVLVVDKLTYAGSLKNIKPEIGRLKILIQDICKVDEEMLGDYDYLVNFAAESHVDNSIQDGRPFIRTNIEGTFNLIELARKNPNLKKFIQISTDEVYGDIAEYGSNVEATEEFAIKGSSYYAASKSSADLLIKSAGNTYGLPYLITRTCNNFGPRQHTEKFIPKLIYSVKNNIPIGVYGTGDNIREWIYVEDNVRIILNLINTDRTGIFNIGSSDRVSNNEIIEYVEEIVGKTITKRYIEDRKGHDKKYALSSSKLDNFTITKTLKEYLNEQLYEY